jgi:hypothetical protein
MCVCVCVCVFLHNSGTPGAIATKLGTHMTICMYKNLMFIIYIYILYNCIYKKMDYVCVCMFQHNSGTPAAISTKLGTHMTIWSVYIIYI